MQGLLNVIYGKSTTKITPNNIPKINKPIFSLDSKKAEKAAIETTNKIIKMVTFPIPILFFIINSFESVFEVCLLTYSFLQITINLKNYY